jgi:hypothetical protein
MLSKSHRQSSWPALGNVLELMPGKLSGGFKLTKVITLVIRSIGFYVPPNLHAEVFLCHQCFEHKDCVLMDYTSIYNTILPYLSINALYSDVPSVHSILPEQDLLVCSTVQVKQISKSMLAAKSFSATSDLSAVRYKDHLQHELLSIM